LATQPGQQEFNEEQSDRRCYRDRDQCAHDQVGPDLREDLVAENYRPRPAGGRDQPVEQVPDARQIGQQIDGQHQHVTVGGRRAQDDPDDPDDPARADQPAEDRTTRHQPAELMQALPQVRLRIVLLAAVRAEVDLLGDKGYQGVGGELASRTRDEA